MKQKTSKQKLQYELKSSHVIRQNEQHDPTKDQERTQVLQKVKKFLFH